MFANVVRLKVVSHFCWEEELFSPESISSISESVSSAATINRRPVFDLEGVECLERTENILISVKAET